MVSLQGRGVVSTLVCAKMAHPVLTKAFLQSAKAATMCTVHSAENLHTSPYPTFFVRANLSSQWSASTDNMWPKSDEHINHGG